MADDTSLVFLNQLNARLSLRRVTDSGAVQALSTDVSGTPVYFNKAFLDIINIQATAKSTSAYTTVYDYIDQPYASRAHYVSGTGNSEIIWAAVQGGDLGDDITIEMDATGTNAETTVLADSEARTVYVLLESNGGTPLATAEDVVSVLTIDTETRKLITVSLGGDGSDVVSSLSETNLTTPCFYVMVFDKDGNRVSTKVSWNVTGYLDTSV